MVTTNMARAASVKQLDLIGRLASERGVEAPATDGLTSGAASDLISRLMAMPRPARTRAARPAGADLLERGVYLREGRVFRVYLNQRRDTMLAKEPIKADGVTTWKYHGDASRILSPGMRVTSREQVAAYGLEFDACMVCGTALEDPESKAAGIGPVCASRF